MVQKLLNLGQYFGKCWTFSCDTPPDQPFLITSDLFLAKQVVIKENWGYFWNKYKILSYVQLKKFWNKQILKILRPFGRKLQPALVDFACSPGVNSQKFYRISASSDFWVIKNPRIAYVKDFRLQILFHRIVNYTIKFFIIIQLRWDFL